MTLRSDAGGSRRDFLRRAATASATLFVAARAGAESSASAPMHAMHHMAGMGEMSTMGGMAMDGMPQQRGVHDSSLVQTQRDTTNLFVMDQRAARAVVRPPKRDATPLLSDAQRDDLEHRIRCQCGCTLDVFTCRTTDFSCQVSPAMHRDVLALVRGGYSAQEIIDAFVGTYGERVLMSPAKSGFNLVGWVTPGLALVVGGFAIAVMLRRWRVPSARIVSRDGAMSAPTRGDALPPVDATPDELARLEAAVKGDADR
jgi:cytochrome c-type biogenesis protein CcmH